MVCLHDQNLPNVFLCCYVTMYVLCYICYYVTYVTMSLHRSFLLNFWNCWDFQEANLLARIVSTVYMLCRMETNCVEID